jgi:hypothetical protein
MSIGHSFESVLLNKYAQNPADVAIKENAMEENKQAAEALFEKVDEWTFENQELWELFSLFQQSYFRVFELISKINPDLLSETVKELIESGPSTDEDDEEDQKQEEFLAQIAATFGNLQQRLARLGQLPYLVEPEQNNWAEEFSPSEFIDIVNKLVANAEDAVKLVLGDDVEISEAVAADLAADLNQYVEEKGTEGGRRYTGDVVQQRAEAQRRYRAKLREAAKFGEAHTHWASLQLQKATTDRYFKKLRQDPERYERNKSLQREKNKRFKEREATRELLLKQYDLATSPEEKARIKRKIEDLEVKLRTQRYKDPFTIEEENVRLRSQDHVSKLREEISRKQKARQSYVAKDVAKKREGRTIRNIPGLISELQIQLANRKSDVTKKLKTELQRRMDLFASYLEAIADAKNKLELAPSGAAKLLADQQLKEANKALAAAMKTVIDQDPRIIRMEEQNASLYTFRDIIKAMLQDNTISDDGTINITDPDQVEQIIYTIQALHGYITDFNNNVKMETKAAKTALELLTNIVGANPWLAGGQS